MSEKKELTINQKLATIQTLFKSKKSRFNSFGKYNFRSAEDILEAVKPYLLTHNVSVVITEDIVEWATTFPILRSTAILSDGKDAIHACAIVGVDLDQKGMQMPQKFGSASSYGKKYALGNLFLIDDTQDSDASNTHGTTKSKPMLEGQALEKAKEFIKNGGTLDAIKNKYQISDEILNTL